MEDNITGGGFFKDMENHDTVKIYRSFRDAARDLPDAERLAFWDAVIDYGLDGVEPQASGIAKTLFTAVKPNIDNYRDSVFIGKTGGRPTTKTGGKTGVKRGVLTGDKTGVKTELNRIELNRIEEEKESIKKKTRFAPPSLEDVQAYKAERGDKGKNVDPETFINFYSAKGWKVGSSPMKDWRAAFRTWEKRGERTPAAPKKSNSFNFDGQRDYDYEALERALAEG